MLSISNIFYTNFGGVIGERLEATNLVDSVMGYAEE